MSIMEIRGTTADELWAEALWRFDNGAIKENTRNGMVMTQPAPVTITLTHPEYRIIHSNERDANPFFHLMEFVWMMAGRNDAEWISQFNKGITQYSESNGKFHGAYGFRWRRAFMGDQLLCLVRQMKSDLHSRQHVLQMWAPALDLLDVKPVNDKPCNVTILFRFDRNGLNMTVINRSNDLVWGALGANIVHMTMLHELIARSIPCDLGVYRVISNNMHVYERHWHFLDRDSAAKADGYKYESEGYAPKALVTPSVERWLQDAESFCNENPTELPWFDEVARPMRNAYLDKPNRAQWIKEVQCPAWKHAAELWSARHTV